MNSTFSRSSWNLNTLLNFNDISQKTKDYMAKVYATLLLNTLVCAVGMVLNQSIVMSGFFFQLLFIGLTIFLTCQITNAYKSEKERLGYLAGLAFCFGFLVGPLINRIAELQPELLIQAVLYTGVAFVSFSLVSLMSKRRSWLFLGSIIVTLIQGMLMYRLFSWIFGYSTFNLPYLLVGLFVACLYIIFDT